MPTLTRTEFQNSDGETLSAALTLPDGTVRGCVLFAHCFTCGKNAIAASRLGRYLAARGMAVLRFDFTGIGNSEGDFGNTNFASNVHDLLAAADHLRANHGAPAVLIGHSLGGTAVLAATAQVPECRAVVTIGAPASPQHVVDRLGRDDGMVQVGDRVFAIDRNFVAEHSEAQLQETVAALHRALLVMHAPLDPIVPVAEASKIFQAAKHPKSFISLDDADHLLTRAEDAEYVAQTVTAWVSRYLPDTTATTEPVAEGAVRVGEANRKFLRQVETDSHTWVADEPKRVGGQDLGPDPYEHLLAALGTCTSMTLRMYANRKSWPLDDVDVTVTHSREHATDCEGCEETPQRIEVLDRAIRLKGDLSGDQRERLLQIADRCPVHRTLESDLQIRTTTMGSE